MPTWQVTARLAVKEFRAEFLDSPETRAILSMSPDTLTGVLPMKYRKVYADGTRNVVARIKTRHRTNEKAQKRGRMNDKDARALHVKGAPSFSEE